MEYGDPSFRRGPEESEEELFKDPAELEEYENRLEEEKKAVEEFGQDLGEERGESEGEQSPQSGRVLWLLKWFLLLGLLFYLMQPFLHPPEEKRGGGPKKGAPPAQIRAVAPVPLPDEPTVLLTGRVVFRGKNPKPALTLLLVTGKYKRLLKVTPHLLPGGILKEKVILYGEKSSIREIDSLFAVQNGYKTWRRNHLPIEGERVAVGEIRMEEDR